MERISLAGLQVDAGFAQFVEQEVLPGTGLQANSFWAELAELTSRFTARNTELLAKRERLQLAIDGWHRDNPQAGGGAPESFLREIGYLLPEPAPFTIGTENVDTEIAQIAGPQLVVPVLNARFLLNAANARWGSLYDALYGTDALDGSLPPKGPYDDARGAKVVAWGKYFLDQHVPLASGSWTNWQGGTPVLADRGQLIGFSGRNILLRHNDLHIELVIDPQSKIGSQDPAAIADIELEAAISTLVDLEDSVAAVDAPDKINAYRNWLGIMRGDLQAHFSKGGQDVTRTLAPNREYISREGTPLTLAGRSLMLVRNVGHLMTNPAILLEDGSEIFEGILDAVMTSTIALHDLKQLGTHQNSRAGSVYIVKPKMHGAQECAFANDLFNAVEDMLGLARHTIKIGVMDEERRTSANLAACIHSVRERIFFINTGFLDRTGDEIHTSMLAGPMLRKAEIKLAEWIKAYEDRNVQIGLACGFAGRAQIGKGMWAAPDRMADMLREKISHTKSGASTAWVPSPTGAVLHAVHYHRCNVSDRQLERTQEEIAPLAALLSVPLAKGKAWNVDEIREELDNNIQGILGYVVRWIDQGVGCSKVPDIHDIGLMEDRATLRISSQHIANWLLHGVISRDDVEQVLTRMAKVVDEQNAGDHAYVPMSKRAVIKADDSLPVETARRLIFEGVDQPSGYTEPLLHQFRQQAKRAECEAIVEEAATSLMAAVGG